MKLHIREFDGSDDYYQTAVNISNIANPRSKGTVEDMKHFDKTRNPNFYFRRGLIMNGGVTVAAGVFMEKWWTTEDEDYAAKISVLPDQPYKKIATCFYQWVQQEIQSRQPKKLTTFLFEDETEQVQFHTAAGYKLIQREPLSELNVATFDFGKFAQAEEKIKAQGFEIVTLPELQKRFDNWQQLDYELVFPILQDIPSPAELKLPFEEFSKQYDSPNLLPECNFYALDVETQKWVGTSILDTNSADSQRLDVSLTGVHKAYRGKGIATALKVKTIEFARDYGAQTIHTENDENNSMYDLNMLLGFRPKPAFVTYELAL